MMSGSLMYPWAMLSETSHTSCHSFSSCSRSQPSFIQESYKHDGLRLIDGLGDGGSLCPVNVGLAGRPLAWVYFLSSHFFAFDFFRLGAWSIGI